MDYRKPSKRAANEAFLRGMPMTIGEPYQEATIEQKKAFLIICEGENTEPLYFEGFPVPSKTVVTEGGRGSKTSLVNYAIKIKALPKYEGREVWCVFDFDVKPDEAATQPADFNNAILKAEQNDMKTAWSNDAFEIWFVLHYQGLEAALTR
ncbi:MAG TPA: RloB family protein, partial [Cyclobacteriaceae bacterium]|nr:RloB family protein [Cyclobacteriaceae bacterium]